MATVFKTCRSHAAPKSGYRNEWAASEKETVYCHNNVEGPDIHCISVQGNA